MFNLVITVYVNESNLKKKLMDSLQFE